MDFEMMTKREIVMWLEEHGVSATTRPRKSTLVALATEIQDDIDRAMSQCTMNKTCPMEAKRAKAIWYSAATVTGLMGIGFLDALTRRNMTTEFETGVIVLSILTGVAFIASIVKAFKN